MTDKEYLEAVLENQDLKDDSPEMKDLQKERANVEKLLRAGFPDCSPTIRYGGSKAKNTLIKEDYDLDIASYFPHDDASAGETLKDIYDNTEKALAGEHNVVRKRTALRLRSKKDVDFHIDVVPGRFTDDDKSDCFLHQEGSDKDRLKTNLDVHIEHIRDSGFVPAIRVLKLWKTRKALDVKQFAFELLIVKLLDGTDKSLPEQVKYVWTELRDRAEPVAIEDPANPTGNDLSDLLNETVWAELSAVAKSTLATLENDGWEAIFGKVSSGDDKAEKAQRAAATVITPQQTMVASGVAPSYQKLEAEVQESHPDLRLVVRNGQPMFRGSFPVRHDGDEIDRFQIEISFPEGINKLPAIREIGGRIPRDADHHVNAGTGDICTDVPELILLRGQPSLVEYLDGPVRNFFLSQIIVASGKTWPFGQWDHGKKGLLQAYGELLGVTDERQIRAYLDYVASKKAKGHWPCPCGGMKPLRDCHAKQIAALRERIPRRIAASALTRLDECP